MLRLPSPAPRPMRRDVPKADVHILNAGHFALDEATDQIASLVRDFLDRQNLPKKGR